MPDYAPITAAIQLLRLLRRGWSTRYELADQLGLHERVIRRMLDTLRAGDIPIAQRPRAGSLTHEYHRTRSL